jgi:hypothetical protein
MTSFSTKFYLRCIRYYSLFSTSTKILLVHERPLSVYESKKRACRITRLQNVEECNPRKLYYTSLHLSDSILMDDWNKRNEEWQSDSDRREKKYWRKILFQYHSVRHKSHINLPIAKLFFSSPLYKNSVQSSLVLCKWIILQQIRIWRQILTWNMLIRCEEKIWIERFLGGWEGGEERQVPFCRPDQTTMRVIDL